ncbi:GrpB family protein [Arenicella xantha]|uniref:GrpB-like predicted nucleotidyltransferase (UPF0157 family) n=1 Tax=Arenicella xantha TaxID=644221 RepID=A0A395JHB4_9GAMM|nr:GrpB family protein [Arenicella xantha]RBP49225.1 GrpB-like predicted nucleotidyltransferase (UPF0157 family) [Arenicella xantha]
MYIFPHDPLWKNEFEITSKKLLEVADIEIELHHIGSTSIQGLYAKNCIDILGVISDFSLGHTFIEPFKSLGLTYKGEYGIAGRHYFSGRENPKTHLHVLPLGHEQIDTHLHFKNIMSKKPELVKELNELKKALSSQFTKEIYQIKKKVFYDKVSKIEL